LTARKRGDCRSPANRPLQEVAATRAGERERTWFEKHAGTFAIALTFGVVILMVIAKNSCL